MRASRETVKMKTPEGEVKMAVLGDSPGAEEYLQHLNAFLRMLTRKKYEDEMTKLSKAVVTAAALVRRLVKIPNKETEPETSQRITKKWDDELTKLTKAVVSITALVRRLARTPSNEKEPNMSKRLSLWEAAEAELNKAKASESAKVGLVYELFCKGLKEDPELQWDRMVDDMHAKDPWGDLRGVKHGGLHRKSSASLFPMGVH